MANKFHSALNKKDYTWKEKNIEMFTDAKKIWNDLNVDEVREQ